ncbi:MAG: T9SS type A sorting domain-containing protein [Flavobacteriales bacterium]|jgi:alpha-tubulin suppressor-like RCC1 family protein|nr:T9SS type A sorting domain-containing protein [Flavobacteriales bacterium]
MKILLFVLLFFTSSYYLNAQCWLEVASKYDQTLAIKSDSSLWRWGGSRYTYERTLNHPNLVDSSQKWKAVSTGTAYYAAITDSGALWTWGDNSYGQIGNGTTTNLWTPTQLDMNRDWAAISCGPDFMIALKSNGSLWSWGRNRTTSPTQIETDTTWIAISSGKERSLGIKADRSLWLINSGGTQAIDNGQWKAVSKGNYTDYGIKSDGSLWTWNNSNRTPIRVGNDSDWKSLDCSHLNHALFVKNNGTLWAVGVNNFGQLGDNSITNKTAPVQIGTANNWEKVIAGNLYSLALQTNRSLWGWGRNNHAQFGNGKNKNTPQPVDTSMHWRKATSSMAYQSGHTLAIKEDGTLWAWGQNNDGQLGNGSTYTHAVLPIQISNDTTWHSIANGFFFSVATKTDGTLWTWGRNGRGQLGLGSFVFKKTTPTQVGTDSTWNMVSAGSEFALALKNDGTLWAWGYNYNGQLGDGTTTTRHTPIQIGSDSNWVYINAGAKHSFGIKADSTLWSWGSDQHGQAGRGGNLRVPMQVGTDKWVTIHGGGMHSVGIKNDSTLWTWGRNLYAQLGDGTTTSKGIPYQIDTLHRWIKAAAGYEHSLAIQTDGSLWAWGRNNGGQVGDSTSYSAFLSKAYIPTKISDSNWSDINGGPINSIAINSNNHIFTFGSGYSTTYQSNFPQLGYVFSSPNQISNCNFCPPSYSTTIEDICTGDTILFNGSPLTTAGVYTDTLTSNTGCDSIVMLTIINHESYSTVDTVVCSNYVTPSGIPLSQSGTYFDTIPNLYGCDSIITINLIINNSFSSIDIDECNNYTSPSGVNWTASGVYTDTIINHLGCDSIITINLTILQSFDTLYIDECNSYTSPSGQLFTSSGTYNDTITNTAGCDSIITINLNIQQSYSTLTTEECHSYISPSGRTIMNSGTYTDTITNYVGCDSIITINLTIQTIDTSVTQSGIHLTANETNASYQWLNCDDNFAIINGANAATYTPYSNGNYAVEISLNNCVDTSNCKLINSVSIDESSTVLFSIFPNPTSESFTIQCFQNIKHGYLNITNLSGQRIYSSELNNTSKIYIPEATLKPGIYTISITTQKNTHSQKLIKR